MFDTVKVPAKGRGGRYPHGFAAVDNRIVTHYGPRIGATGLALYLALAVHANSKTRTCFPSMATLSRYLQVSRPTLRKALRQLEAAGLVTVVRRHTATGTRRVNQYTLLPIPNEQLADPSEGNDVAHADPNGQAAFPPDGNHVSLDRKGACQEQYVINKTQENQREGVGGVGSPAHPVASPSHPAIQAYRDACKLTPDATQRAAIAATVTDLAKWQAVVQQWLLAGFRKQNVAGMLDWYRDGIPDRSGQHRRYAAGKGLGFQGNRPGEWGESHPPETPEETARLDAEWEVYGREARERSRSE